MSVLSPGFYCKSKLLTVPSDADSANQCMSQNVMFKLRVFDFPQNPTITSKFESLNKRFFVVKCTESNQTKPIMPYMAKIIWARQYDWFVSVRRSVTALAKPKIDDGRGGNGGPPTGGGGRDGDGGEENEEDEKEFGSIMNYEEVLRELKKREVLSIPSDMLDAARTTGIRQLILSRFLDFQGSVWPLGFLMRNCTMLRNRMLADPSFLFKVGIEIAIDTCCATFAEVQKRGKDFWAEFELYAADVLVGIVVDIALVGLLAPYVRFGKRSVSYGFFGRIRDACAALPSSVFEAERPGCRFSVRQRIGTYFYKGVLYGSVGFGCGLIGQGIANMVMTAKRSMKKSEGDIPVPPLVKSAALWGIFLAVSSNTRYQIINGLERLVEASPLAKEIPVVAMAFTFGVRFANNTYGGMQFVDWAKWSGVQ